MKTSNILNQHSTYKIKKNLKNISESMHQQEETSIMSKISIFM
jgi:hypothetical protein